MSNKKKKNFKCKSEAQKKAIRASYAKLQEKQSYVPVNIKSHRDNNGGHFHVILENIDDKHVSVGLSTNQKKGKNATNYAMVESPLGDGKNSYMRRQGTVDLMKNYFSPREGKMVLIDYERAKVYGERAKQKYLEDKKK